METLTVAQKIDTVIKEIEESTNYSVFSEMKAALNSVYGEERNQIVKPSYETIISRLKEDGAYETSIVYLQGYDQDGVSRFLKNSSSNVLTYQIIIHFPEITIRNEKQEHLIRNIYVRILLRPNGKIACQISGMRTTVTEAELVSSYVHSHLPRLNAQEITFQPFCTGIGEINQLLLLLGTTYTPANFMMLLMHIKNYLEWESKEGHPYIFMESVFQRSNRLDQTNNLSDWLAELAAESVIDILRGQRVEDVMKLFEFSVSERGIKATANLDMEKWIGALANHWNPGEMFGTNYGRHVFQSLRDVEGKYFAIPEGMRNISYQQGPILNFKGRDIEFEVIEKTQITTTHEIYANPKISKAVSKKFSSVLNKTALTSPGIKSGSALIYNTGTASTGHISVPKSVE